MKYSITWGQQYSNVDLASIPVDQLSASIGEQLGAIEEIIDLSKKYKDAYVVKVISAVKHPNSDKLSLCLIDDNKAVKSVKRNKDGYVQVVCGAPNVKTGMLAVWLPPGSTVPSSFNDKEPFTLSDREIRGEVSHGMLASPKELDLSDEHEGILELENTETVKPGATFAKVYNLNDTIIDLENKMFTHRPDCFGILGVSRELAGINGMDFVSPDWYLKQSELPNNDFNSKNDISEQVPRFAVQVIENITVGDSNQETVSLLTKVGSTPINDVVDLTNYYMHLTAQPTHAFDYDKVAKLCSGKVSIFPRMAKEGEELELLNGKTIKLTSSDIVIATDKQPIALAGIMGGKQTEVDDNTKNIIVECANFNMYSIRRSSMNHGLFTDAVTRFNKGQSTYQNAVVLNKLSQEIASKCGGKLGPAYDSNPELVNEHQSAIKVDSHLINKGLGSELSPMEMANLLKSTEFKVDIREDQLLVSPPFWRTDIEIAEDIVEEIGRLYGYDKLPTELPKRPILPTEKNQILEFTNRIRNIMSSAGANEVLGYSFVSERLLQNCGQNPKEAYHLSNALSPDLQCYRLSLTPSLLSKVNLNLRSGHDQFAIYEIGKTHLKTHGTNDEGLPSELEMFALVYALNDKKAAKHQGAAYFQARKYLDYLANRLGLILSYTPIEEKPEYEVARPFDWKRSAVVADHNTGNILGMIGEYTASTRKNLKLPQNSAGFEINYRMLMDVAAGIRPYQPLAKYPGTIKDISIESDIKVPNADIIGYAEHACSELALRDGYNFTVSTIDLYAKASSEQKTTTIRLEIHNPTKTLTTKESTEISDQVLKFVTDSIAKR